MATPAYAQGGINEDCEIKIMIYAWDDVVRVDDTFLRSTL
ncbi:hypothetical protein L915_14517 [Phytophthora nicotianae]|uniref:Uncharacterized protein n=1 Tax=Phytophthora nicotianae TaxID=4792 RepID=W2J6T6_PHYNI|nr:hypothetical protein L915_14517 [Phytophthora nicotianae]ETL42114.1 hypothetical protein L916_07016 [Phytophthora nicotianae]ETM39491.1 hypothetical protein L914_14366 [Phytophthora nicotianae]